MAKSATKTDSNTANIGLEAKLWLAADKLRNNMDAAEYNRVRSQGHPDGPEPPVDCCERSAGGGNVSPSNGGGFA